MMLGGTIAANNRLKLLTYYCAIKMLRNRSVLKDNLRVRQPQLNNYVKFRRIHICVT